MRKIHLQEKTYKTSRFADSIYFILSGIIVSALYQGFSDSVRQLYAKPQDNFPIKYSKVYADSLTPSPTPLPDASETTIDGYIVKVFGKDAPKAFLLLTCENSTHDPDLVNTAGNYPPGSRDIGVFMVNEYWQEVNPKYLFNWKINIHIAKQLYDENHGTFRMWTCGKKLGI